MNSHIITKTQASKDELDSRERFLNLFNECPVPDNELLANLMLFIKRQDITRLLFLNDLYKKILNIHGIIIEFGVRWGRDLSLFESFRGIYEPYNHTRRIIGFDTFGGFPSTHAKDGLADIVTVGGYSTTSGYEEYLEQILDYHEKESPLSHIKKYELVKGNASVEIKKFLKKNPETIVAFAYFDFDLYEPTKNCIEAIKGHLTKGSIIGFDELNLSIFPGETLALKEAFGLSRYSIFRSPYSAAQSYLVIE